MRRQSFLTGLGLSLAITLLASRPAAAEEALYQPGGYLDAAGGSASCCTPTCDAPCGGCGDAWCGSCCCSSCSGWYAGVDAFWAQPRIKDNNAFSSRTSVNGVSTASNTPYDYDYDITPRIWLGYMNCCGTGFRGSWWKYEDDADPVVQRVVNTTLAGRILDVSTGTTFRSSQSLELELADLELTNAFDLCGGCALVSYGVRYVRYASETREQFNNNTSGLLIAQGVVSDSFDGFGPTLALEFNRPVNCRWSVYGKMRGTIAMGDRDTVATARANFRNVSGGEEAFAIAELQLGVQWNYCCWFVRAGWQAQYWDDAMEVILPARDAIFNPGTLGDIAVQGFNISVGYGR